MGDNYAGNCGWNASHDSQGSDPPGDTVVDPESYTVYQRGKTEEYAGNAGKSCLDLSNAEGGLKYCSLPGFRRRGPTVNHYLKGNTVDGLERRCHRQACDRSSRPQSSPFSGLAIRHSTGQQHERCDYEYHTEQLHQVSGYPVMIGRVFNEGGQRNTGVRIHGMQKGPNK